MNKFFNSQFNYSSLIWMFHNQALNNKIIRFHNRCLHAIYNNKIIIFKNQLNIILSLYTLEAYEHLQLRCIKQPYILKRMKYFSLEENIIIYALRHLNLLSHPFIVFITVWSLYLFWDLKFENWLYPLFDRWTLFLVLRKR